jgi:transposase-like protein
MFKNGESVSEVCAELGIHKDTFFEWVKTYKEFSDAYKKGLELSEAWWTKLGRAGATGKAKIQPATWIFNMKNRFKWTDRVEQVVTATVDTAAADMSPEDRRKKIAEMIGTKSEP